MREGVSTAAAAGVVVSLLIVGAVAAIGYYQFEVAPNITTSTTSTSSTHTGLPAPGTYVNVTIPSGASSPPGPGYSPATVTVVIGHNATVVWVNSDPSSIHTVTATDNSFNSGDMHEGDTYMHQFSTPGTYTYHCIYHSWMKATIIVKSG